MRYSFIWGLLLFFFGIVTVNTASTENEAASITTVSNVRYVITFTGARQSKDRPWLRDYLFEVSDKSSGEIRQFVLEEGTHKPIEKYLLKLEFLRDDRLSVKIKWRGRPDAATCIYIVDLGNAKLIDKFCCRSPTLSPSKQFWVCEMWYPPHGLPSSATSVVLIYDMERSPTENRVPVKGYTKWPKTQVGLPIYPALYVEARAYVLLEQQHWPASWRYHIASPFLWSEDEKKVLFLCTHHERTHIVKVDLSSGIEKPMIFELPIKITEEFVKPRYKKEFELNSKRNPKVTCILSADQIKWDGPNQVIAEPNKAHYMLQEEIILRVPLR
ncbi:hypothetical protein KAX35_08340 [candidate division WOR-3 bacterium]|nr:hypothetical protein [candidate division WOR-3 bacterium]